MKRFQSTYLLWVLAAVLLVGFYTVDRGLNEASVISLPDFSASPTETETVEKSNKEPSQTLQAFNDEIVNIAERAKSAVVTVNVVQTVEAQNPLARFFGERGQPEEYQREGLGSGVIVSKDGYILTNNHVVENADEVEVQLYGGQSSKAEIIGTDPRTDIAVLKIDSKNINERNVIALGNSNNLRVGELVLAIGSPLQENLAHSVSMGIVSAKERSIGILNESAGYENFIQTDAAINPGNSGGALVNMDGQLIGINSAIASRSGGSDGIGFAVPIDMAKSVMKSLIEHGKVVRAYLGIYGQDLNRNLARALDLDNSQGIIVNQVQEDTPAEEAGLKEGDVIKTLNGNTVHDYSNFRTQIATSNPGDEITLGIVRDGNKQELTVTLGELPSDLAVNQQPQSREQESLGKTLGFRVRNLSPEIAQQLGMSPDQEGVVVTEISRGSNAYRQGLRQGSVITEVDRKPVSDVSDFNKIMNNLVEQGKDVALVRVTNGEASQLIAFEL
jgi:serine protease Do